MGEKLSIAEILAAAKAQKETMDAAEAKKKREADEAAAAAEREAQEAGAAEAAKQREAEEAAVTAELEKQQAADQKIEDFKAKQERLVQIQGQRDADAESLKAIRAQLKDDRQTLRDYKLPKGDEAIALEKIKEASKDETGGGELSRAEIQNRRKETREEKAVLTKDVKESLNDPEFQSELQNREAREQEKARLEGELGVAEERIRDLSEELQATEEINQAWEKINADTAKLYGEHYKWTEENPGIKNRIGDLVREIGGFEDLLNRVKAGSEIPAHLVEKYPDEAALENKIEGMRAKLAPIQAESDEFENRFQQLEADRENTPSWGDLAKKLGRKVGYDPEVLKVKIKDITDKKSAIQERIDALKS